MNDNSPNVSSDGISRRDMIKSIVPAGAALAMGAPLVATSAQMPEDSPSDTRRFKIDAAKTVAPNTRFWQAAGSDLLWYLTPRPAGQALLDRMQQTKSCRYLRNHYTFNDKKAHGHEIGAGVVRPDGSYDFERINRHYREFVKRGIKPVVEYDFIPAALAKADANSNDADNMESFIQAGGPRDWTKWADLLKAFTKNLIEQFGAEEVRTWYFEAWNEPDFWPEDDVQTFYRLYDVFVDCVTSVDAKLRVGGPAAFHDFFLRGFLHHITQGTNFVTGKKGTRIDFISYHSYGISGNWLHAHPLVRPTVNKIVCDVLYALRIIDEFGLLGVEFHLNEWGLSSKYSKTVDNFPCLEYRNSEFSALFMAKLVNSFFAMHDLFKGYKGDARPFSPAMMLYWGFSFEAAGEKFFRGMRDLSTAGNVPKPIQTAHEMLAKLGDDRLFVSGPPVGGEAGLMATRTANELQFLAYLFNEYDETSGKPARFAVELENLSGAALELTSYTMDDRRHNTYRAWQRAGSPKTVKEADVAALIRAGELTPESAGRVSIHSGRAVVEFELPRHAMRLYVAKPV